jgi:hypothetical protein
VLIRHLTDDVSIDLLFIKHSKEIALKQKRKKTNIFNAKGVSNQNSVRLFLYNNNDRFVLLDLDHKFFRVTLTRFHMLRFLCFSF